MHVRSIPRAGVRPDARKAKMSIRFVKPALGEKPGLPLAAKLAK
jgi:hypothetical protein